jgi:hypothetical protein
MNNLKMIGLAMHNYAGANENRFPPAAIRKNGKALLSWRVAILPYLDQNALYERFHLDEPWDSPHNKTLLKEMPPVFAGSALEKTLYQVFVGPGALFEGDEGTKLSAVTDGIAFTVLVAEGAKAVPWTKPEDLTYDPEKPLPELGGMLPDGIAVCFADGSARILRKTIPASTLRALITRNGGEVVSADDL